MRGSCQWIIIKIKASAKECMVSGVKGDDIRIIALVSLKDVTRERVMVTLKFVVLSKKKNVTMQSYNVDDYKNSD